MINDSLHARVAAILNRSGALVVTIIVRGAPIRYSGRPGSPGSIVMRQMLRLLPTLLAFAALGACEAEPQADPSTEARAPRPVATAAAPDPAGRPAAARDAAPARDPFVLVVLGDSLTAGEGLPADAALAAQLGRLLAARGLHAVVRDASAPGDAIGQGLARFDKAVAEDVDGIILALGGDDGARGASAEAVESTLAAIIERARARGLWVGLVGVDAPRSAEPDDQARFEALYPELSEAYGLELYPHIYSGLIDHESGEARPELFRSDGVHPTDLGMAIVAEGMADWLADTLPAEAVR